MVSLAIVRPVSLRPQDSGQKNSHGLKGCTRSLWPRIFLTFVFSMHRDSKRICKRDRLRLLRLRPSNILSLIEQVPHTCKIRLIRSISVRKNIRVYIKLNTNLPNLPNHLMCRQNQKNIRLKSHLSCQGTIKIKTKIKRKLKNYIKKRIRVKDSVASVIIRERFLI